MTATIPIDTLIPSPELLSARGQLLDGIVAAGKLGSEKKAKAGGDNDRPINAVDPSYKPPMTWHEIYLEAAKRQAEKFRVVWEKAKAERDEIVAYSAATKTTPPDHYWQPEVRARGLYGSALALVEALS